MPLIKSFHSAPHSIVQAALARAAKQLAPAATADAAITPDTAHGIAAFEGRMKEATAILHTIPRRRTAGPFERVATNPLGATGTLSAECLELMVRYVEAEFFGDAAEKAALRDAFLKSSCDAVDWLGTAFLYLVTQLEASGPIQYIPPGDHDDERFIHELPEQDSFRIGILGDWGTGEPVAQIVVDAMVAMGVDLMIHVGDVYYAGTEDEAHANYLEMIATARQRASTTLKAAAFVPIYNMPGNHDYYTRGKPFYDALGTVNAGTSFPSTPGRPAPTQRGSFFVLRNSWLQLEAMDTGYYDSDLFAVANDTTQLIELEAEWHLRRLDEAKRDGRTVFLFSHHQPWSRYLGIGVGPGTAGGLSIGDLPPTTYNVNLARQLAGVPQGLVRGWFWGHEHVLQVYDKAAIDASRVPSDLPRRCWLLDLMSLFGRVAPARAPKATKPLTSIFPWMTYGACIGNSAFPMLESDDPYHVAAIATKMAANPAYQSEPMPCGGADEQVYSHGFTILTVTKATTGRPTATASYYWLPPDGMAPAEPGAPPRPATPTLYEPVSTIP